MSIVASFLRKVLRQPDVPGTLASVTAQDVAVPDGEWVDHPVWHNRTLRNGSRLIVARDEKDFTMWTFGWQEFSALGEYHYPRWSSRRFPDVDSACRAADEWLERTLK